MLRPSVWACVGCRTLWVSPGNSPVRLGVSPTASSTPTGVFNQWFEALFPRPGALCCAVCYQICQLLPCLPHSTTHCLLGSVSHCLACPGFQPLPCCESSPSGCLSPPLLLVWMNVSSLTPWLLDFHTVRFSVSSGCFLFLNCCPSLVVRGGTVCLPMPPSWPEAPPQVFSFRGFRLYFPALEPWVAQSALLHAPLPRSSWLICARMGGCRVC